MLKFFVDKEQINDDNIIIAGQDAIHIKKVLRLKKDTLINISDNKKNTYECKIEEIKNDEIKCKIIEKKEEDNENSINITLFQGIAKFDKMDYIIQKATELGINIFYPTITKRTVVKLDDKSKEKKVQRWQQIANEASKQCKRTCIPKIENVIFLKDICNLVSSYDIILLAYEKDNNCLKNILTNINRNIKDIAVIIGPEGGFEEDEIDMLLKYKNINSISLGKRILRTETASILLISNILYEFNEM